MTDLVWTPTLADPTPWGRPRVTIGGVDVTFFRGKFVQIVSCDFSDPYGYADATISLPQVTAFELPTDGGVSTSVPWLHKGALVNIERVDTDGNPVEWWAGFVSLIRTEDQAVSVECDGELSGRLALVYNRPPVVHRDFDLGQLVRQCCGITNASFTLDTPPTTGILLDNAANSGGSRLDYLDWLLSQAYDEASGLWWTIMPKPGFRRRFEMRLKAN